MIFSKNSSKWFKRAKCAVNSTISRLCRNINPAIWTKFHRIATFQDNAPEQCVPLKPCKTTTSTQPLPSWNNLTFSLTSSSKVCSNQKWWTTSDKISQIKLMSMIIVKSTQTDSRHQRMLSKEPRTSTMLTTNSSRSFTMKRELISWSHKRIWFIMSTRRRTNWVSILMSDRKNMQSRKEGSKRRSDWHFLKKKERKWKSAVLHLNCTKSDLMSETKIRNQGGWKLMLKIITINNIMSIKAAQEQMSQHRMTSSITFVMWTLSSLTKKDSSNKRESKSK